MIHGSADVTLADASGNLSFSQYGVASVFEESAPIPKLFTPIMVFLCSQYLCLFRKKMLIDLSTHLLFSIRITGPPESAAHGPVNPLSNTQTCRLKKSNFKNHKSLKLSLYDWYLVLYITGFC